MSLRKCLPLIAGLGLAVMAGCGLEREPAAPAPVSAVPYAGPDKDGSEALGAPSIPIAAGSGISHAGASMVGVGSAELVVDVPPGATVRQVLLYWAGGTQAASGDGQVTVGGIPVEGALIGGPTHFFDWEGPWYFSAYRADITSLGLVHAGQSSLVVSDLRFEVTLEDETDGVSVVVIWDDGRPADLAVRDGLDLAFCGFVGALNTTVPQAFTFAPSPVERVANLVILAASVGENRPNRIIVDIGGGHTVYENPLGGIGNDLWDSLSLPVTVPAGATDLSVQVVSTTSWSPLGASLGWVGVGLAVPRPVVDEPKFPVRGVVFIDTDRDGFQDPFEPGVSNVTVDLQRIADERGWTGTSGPDGHYEFLVPGGAYMMAIPATGAAGAYNGDLSSYFAATTSTDREIFAGAETPTEFFGYVPDPARVLGGISDQALDTNGFTRATWQRFLRCAIHGDRHGDDDDEDGTDGGMPATDDYEMRTRLADGLAGNAASGRLYYDRGGHEDDDHCHCDPDSLPFTPAQIRGFLCTVQTLWLPEPYRFTPGHELQEAYDLLRATPVGDEGRVRQELLVTELNYVVGRGIVLHPTLVESIASWCESLLAWEEAIGPVKGKLQDLGTALTLLQAVNTGGGGGGIE